MVSHLSLQDYIQSENLVHLPLADLANAINNAFLEPMQKFDPFNPNDDQPNSMSDQPLDITTPWETYNKLKLLSTSKAPVPDGVPNFVYKEYAKILACPISSLINCSLAINYYQAYGSWRTLSQFQRKRLYVTLIITHLRHISLTNCLSKLAEEFVIEKFVAPCHPEMHRPSSVRRNNKVIFNYWPY